PSPPRPHPTTCRTGRPSRPSADHAPPNPTPEPDPPTRAKEPDMTVRYAAREVEIDPEVELTQRRIVSKGIDVFYETDPEIIASVLPPPLRPAERPLVRIQIMGVTIGDGELFASGNFTVAAAHGDTEGAYCLFMPQATEPIVVGGRETYGEPKKIADIKLERDGDSVSASVSRYGATLIDI